jgi:hypothetical protein
MLSGDLEVEQAPIFDCLSFNPLSPSSGPNPFQKATPSTSRPVRQPQHGLRAKVPKWQATIERLQRAFPRYDAV